MEHRIDRQRFELSARTVAEAEAAQDRILAVWQGGMDLQLAVALDAALGERTVIVERLELELGSIALEELEEVLPALMIDALLAELRGGSAVGEWEAAEVEFGPLGRVGWYLEHGVLPWWSEPASAALLADELVLAVARNPVALRAWLAQSDGDARVSIRVLRQLGPGALRALAGVRGPEAVAAIDELLAARSGGAVSQSLLEARLMSVWSRLGVRTSPVGTRGSERASTRASDSRPESMGPADVGRAERLPNEGEGSMPDHVDEFGRFEPRTRTHDRVVIHGESVGQGLGDHEHGGLHDEPVWTEQGESLELVEPSASTHVHTRVAILPTAISTPISTPKSTTTPKSETRFESMPAGDWLLATGPELELLHRAIRQGGIVGGVELTRALSAGLSRVVEVVLEALAREAASRATFSSEAQVVLEAAWQLARMHGPALAGIDRSSMSQALVDALPDATRERVAASLEAAPRATQTPARVRELPELADLLPCPQAGLVLVWPFLPSLFEGLGYRRADVWVSREQQERALGLLHYLACGEPGLPDEWALPLHKLLVGLDLDDLAPASFEPTQTELLEVEELLRAILAHWRALKATSVQTLRGGFLCVEGLLSRRGDDWHLRIERRGWDVLIDQLPWSITMIRLPWMRCVVEVGW